MKRATVSVIADGRPINLPADIIEGTNLGTIAARAFRAAKPKLRRGTKQLTIRLNVVETGIPCSNMREFDALSLPPKP